MGMKISEMLTDKYKLRIPPTVYYDLLADVQELEEEEEPTTKNDLAVDCISRADVLKLMQDNWHTHNGDWAMQESMDDIRALPSVTPQEPITWIVGKNNAQIAVKNMPIDKLHKICAIIGDEQEPTTKIEESNFSQEQYLADIQSAYDCGKSVIDKIRAEMFEEMISHSGTGEEVIQAYADGLKKGLEFIDKYKAETEG